MSLSKYSKRRGQFEALEAKQLFAADLMGGDVTAVENLGCHFPPHNAVAETTGTEQHQCFSGKTDFHGNKTDFTISPNYIGGGQEGEPFLFDNLMVAPEGLVNNTSGMDSETEMVEFEHHNDLFASLGGQEGEPLHTAAHEAAHVVQQFGGQEGEPITEESAPVASIAPDGCVDLIGGAAIDLPDTAIVAENISEDDFVIIPLNVRTNLGGQEGEPLMNTNLGDHLVVDGEGLYQRNELELAPNLGGQEGEPVIDPNDCATLVDHVFQDYARDDFQITDQHYFAVR